MNGMNTRSAAQKPARGGVKRQIPRQLGIVLLVFDIAALFFAFLFTKSLSGLIVFLTTHFNLDYDVNHFDTRRYYYFFLCFFIVLRFAVKGHYSRRVPWLGQVQGIFKTIAFAALFDAFNYYFQRGEFFGSFPLLMIFNWGICLLFLIAARYASLMLVSLSRNWRLPIVLVGDNRLIMDSFYAFYADGHTGYEVKQVLLTRSDDPDFDMSFLPKAHPYVELRKDTETFADFIASNPQYYYVFGIEELRGSNRGQFIKALNTSQVEYALIPDIKSLDVYGTEPHYFFGNDIMLIHRRDSIRSPSGRFLKRGIDMLATAFVLPFLGVLTVLVYVMKKIEKSSTPVFYGGKRVGMNGEMFHCWKFCTMKVDGDAILQDLLARDPDAKAEWDKFQKLKNDPRIDSRISKILRKTSLDELPQLWNVFVGDMSLVGPRPILDFQMDDYGDMIQQYYAVRPGLTGLWQVSGRNETSFQQRVYWDSWYIRNWSLWYDIVIIFKTVKVLFTGSGAY
jgi:Undecaprenyl-phosphate galactose phosphotransferase WbaP